MYLYLRYQEQEIVKPLPMVGSDEVVWPATVHEGKRHGTRGMALHLQECPLVFSLYFSLLSQFSMFSLCRILQVVPLFFSLLLPSNCFCWFYCCHKSLEMISVVPLSVSVSLARSRLSSFSIKTIKMNRSTEFDFFHFLPLSPAALPLPHTQPPLRLSQSCSSNFNGFVIFLYFEFNVYQTKVNIMMSSPTHTHSHSTD